MVPLTFSSDMNFGLLMAENATSQCGPIVFERGGFIQYCPAKPKKHNSKKENFTGKRFL